MRDEFIEWEKRVLQELYKDYAQILGERRLPVRPAAISLTDSDSFWAQWNPQTRTILISRKLIRNHNWFRVVSILRHEMAHQLQDEAVFPGSSNDAPHGEKFYSACQKLGVPEEYSKATVCLQTSNLDWREEKRDEVSEKMLERVRKLLSLATSSNEHEALLAMNKVREIYAKYSLEEASAPQQSRFAHITITHRKKRFEAHQNRIISILVGHFFVQVIGTRLFDINSNEYHAGFEIVGTRENAMMAEYVYHFLIHQTDHLVLQISKERHLSRVQKKSYKLGILFGFTEKLSETEKPIKTDNPNSFSDQDSNIIGRALTLFKEDPALDNYISKIYPRLSTRASSSQYIDNSIYADGISIGKQITLNKAMTAAKSNNGLLIRGS
jgi:hypothetical protein